MSSRTHSFLSNTYTHIRTDGNISFGVVFFLYFDFYDVFFSYDARKKPSIYIVSGLLWVHAGIQLGGNGEWKRKKGRRQIRIHAMDSQP